MFIRLKDTEASRQQRMGKDVTIFKHSTGWKHWLQIFNSVSNILASLATGYKICLNMSFDPRHAVLRKILVLCANKDFHVKWLLLAVQL